ncbi:MAG: ATP-binding cassette domain-containing protein, partial [Chloroflexi bacterium]|nr:ATP-binding cassette domain-containing protein [Chloroflexota bacterium]
AGFDVVSEAVQVRLRIGTALQEVGLDPKQSGLELLRLQGSLYGLSRRETNRRIEELEHLVDIGDAMSRLIGTYSGGMKRRLDLAASLIHAPEVLFLDEPTTGLDPISRSRVWEYVRAISREMGVTIFLTTQYLEEADALAERVGIINHGVVSAEGTPAELKRSVGSDVIVADVREPEQGRAALERVRSVQQVDVYENEISISTANGAALISDVALALNQAGVTVNSLTLRTPTLDDVFLHVTGARMEAEAEDAPHDAEREGVAS